MFDRTPSPASVLLPLLPDPSRQSALQREAVAEPGFPAPLTREDRAANRARQGDVWVLLGKHAGDNNQLLAVADALGLPCQVIKPTFRKRLPPNLLLGASLYPLVDRSVLPPGTPRLVLSAGRRATPVARWIRKTFGDATRLVHFGRPWGRVDWFDLVVTTPQYQLPEKPNVIVNSLPFTRVATTPSFERVDFGIDVDQLPRPWTMVLMGGNSRPYVLNEQAASGLAQHANALRAQVGGSLLLVPSPRTPEHALRAAAAALEGPAHVYAKNGPGAAPYRALLSAVDRFVVTSDSAMMAAETLLTSKPVTLFDLPRQPDWRLRAVDWWSRLAQGHRWLENSLTALRENGLITSTRSLEAYHHRLRRAGVFNVAGSAVLLSRSEQSDTLMRIRQLLGLR